MTHDDQRDLLARLHQAFLAVEEAEILAASTAADFAAVEARRIANDTLIEFLEAHLGSSLRGGSRE